MNDYYCPSKQSPSKESNIFQGVVVIPIIHSATRFVSRLFPYTARQEKDLLCIYVYRISRTRQLETILGRATVCAHFYLFVINWQRTKYLNCPFDQIPKRKRISTRRTSSSVCFSCSRQDGSNRWRHDSWHFTSKIGCNPHTGTSG